MALEVGEKIDNVGWILWGLSGGALRGALEE